MSGSHYSPDPTPRKQQPVQAFAELRNHFGPAFDAMPAPLPAPQPDEHTAAHNTLRTAQQREADDVAALREEVARLRAEVAHLAETMRLTTGPVDLALRVDNLVDALQYLKRNVDALRAGAMTDLSVVSHKQAALEGEIAALKVHGKAQAQAIDRIADAVQVMVLKQEDGK